MSKFVLLFVVLFCIVQIALCAVYRERRDTEEKVSSTLDKAGDHISTAFDKTKDAVSSTFTKENLEKVGTSIKEVGDDLFSKVKKAFE